MSAATIARLLICAALAGGYLQLRYRTRRLKRELYVRLYVFSAALLDTLTKHHPQLLEKDHFLVARALREFFLIRIRSGNRLIGMPSKVVDDLWHEFILDTREYGRFCRAAFGHFSHHVPASASAKGENIDEAMRVTWRQACLEENINPGKATRLPLLFAIDEKLSIVGGRRYNTRPPATSPTRAGGPASRSAGGSCSAIACSSSSSGDPGHGCGGHGCGGHGCGGGGGCGGH